MKSESHEVFLKWAGTELLFSGSLSSALSLC